MGETEGAMGDGGGLRDVDLDGLGSPSYRNRSATTKSLDPGV